MCIIEQVEKLEKDMKQLIEDLVGTDEENIDYEQLKRMKKYCDTFKKDLKIQIDRVREFEKNK